MEPIKRTIKLEKLNTEGQIRWFDVIHFSEALRVEVSFDRFEILSVQLTGIDPTDAVLNIRMRKNGPVLLPQKIHLRNYAREFLTREGYLELFPTDKETFIIERLPGAGLCELWLSTDNREFEERPIGCAINILLIPTPD